jgi:aldehyde dehydrogenase (NAD+)
VDKIGESFAVINSMPKPLAAYLFSNDGQLKQQFERTVSAGGIMFNDTGIHVYIYAWLLTFVLLSLLP